VLGSKLTCLLKYEIRVSIVKTETFIPVEVF
jgi:hypothetical protein